MILRSLGRTVAKRATPRVEIPKGLTPMRGGWRKNGREMHFATLYAYPLVCKNAERGLSPL